MEEIGSPSIHYSLSVYRHTAGMIIEKILCKFTGVKICLQPWKALMRKTLRYGLLKNEEDFNRTFLGEVEAFDLKGRVIFRRLVSFGARCF